MESMLYANLPGGWIVAAEVDEDGHLNVYIETEDMAHDEILEIDSGRGDGNREQYALRFTTRAIEDEYLDSLKETLARRAG